MAGSYSSYTFTITYLLICFIVAAPFSYATYQLLFTSDGIPAGADVTFHTYSILRILETNNPLISLTQFPTIFQDNPNHYPSLFHLVIATLTRLVAFNQVPYLDPHFVIQIEKFFMFAVSLVGTAGYALFIRALLATSINNKISSDSTSFLANSKYRLLYLIVSVLAFGVFIFSVTPIIHSYNDGTYVQIFAMWAVFPYYMYLLIYRHWIWSGFLLSIIASSHNLALVMSLSATIPYLISLWLQRVRDMRKNLMKFLVTFSIFTVPAFLFFYLPLATSIITAPRGDIAANLSGPWSLSNVLLQLQPALYYAGVVCTFVLLNISYRNFGWFAGWVAIYYVVFNLTAVIGARFGRELSVVYGIVIGICVAYILFVLITCYKNWFVLFGSFSLQNAGITPVRLILVVIICAIILPLWYGYFYDRFIFTSNPSPAKYFTDTINESNMFFLELSRDDKSNSPRDKGVIVVFGQNYWLKVFTFGLFDVLEVYPAFDDSNIGGGDRRINQELSHILESPTISSTACVLKKYNVDFIYLSDLLQGRYYTNEQIIYYGQMEAFQRTSPSPFIKLDEEFIGRSGEYIRIFSVNKDVVNSACNSMKRD